MAAVTTVVAWMIGEVAPAPGALPATFTPGTDPMTLIGPYLPGFLASTFVTGTVSMVAGWVYLSITVAGLRGYRVMPGWIVRRGLRAFVADVLVMLGFGAAFAVLAILSLAGGPGFTVVVTVTALVPAIYLSVRLVFWSLAIFDGAGIGQGLGATWLISRGSVARMLGWGLTVATIGLLVNVAVTLVTVPLGDGNPVRTGITAAATEAFAAYSMIALAVIYESQRRRSVLRSPVPAWGCRPESPTAPGPFEPPAPRSSLAGRLQARFGAAALLRATRLYRPAPHHETRPATNRAVVADPAEVWPDGLEPGTQAPSMLHRQHNRLYRCRSGAGSDPGAMPRGIHATAGAGIETRGAIS